MVGLGLGVTVGAGVFMATGKASSEAGPASWLKYLKWKLVHVLVVQRPLTQGIVGCTPGPTYPYGKSLYYVGIYGFLHPQESQG